MCIIAYLAADVDLPLVTTTNLNVEDVPEHHQGVRCQFTLNNIVYVGAGGCGCGFTEPVTDDSPADDPRRQLVSYLRPILEQTDRVEIYSAWDGDQFDPRELLTEVRLSELLTNPLTFGERQLVVVRPDSN